MFHTLPVKRLSSVSVLLLIFSIALSSFHVPAQAETRVWTGEAGDDLLTNTENWDSATAWNTGDILSFNGSADEAAELELSTGVTTDGVQLNFTDSQTAAVRIRRISGGGNFLLGSTSNTVAISIAANAGKVTLDGQDANNLLLPLMGNLGAGVLINNAGTLEFGEFTRLLRSVTLLAGGQTTILGGVNANIRLLEDSMLTLEGVWLGGTRFEIDSGRVDFTSAKAVVGNGSSSSQWSAIRIGNNVNDYGTLRYIGANDARIDRRIQIGNGTVGGNQVGSARLENESALGKLVFDNTIFNDVQKGAFAARTLTLGGRNMMDNQITGVIADNHTANGAVISVIKADDGQWVLSGDNSYTGATIIEQGTLAIDAGGSIRHSSRVVVARESIFDVTALVGEFALASDQSIGGAGTVIGDLNFGSGARLVFDATTTCLKVDGEVRFDHSFGVASLLNADGSEIDWASVSNGTYQLLDHDGNFDNICNYGIANAFELGDGRSAYFQGEGLQLVVVSEKASLTRFSGVLALSCVIVRYKPYLQYRIL